MMGVPAIPNEEDDHIEVPDFIGGQDGDVVMVVDGFGMESIGILKGDYVLVRPTEEPEDGAVVVGAYGSSEAVGIFKVHREADRVLAKSDTKSKAAKNASEVWVFGLAIGVMRRIPTPSEHGLEDAPRDPEIGGRDR